MTAATLEPPRDAFTLAQRLAAEALGTALLLAVVIGSGIMGQRLSAAPGNPTSAEQSDDAAHLPDRGQRMQLIRRRVGRPLHPGDGGQRYRVSRPLPHLLEGGGTP